MPALPWTTIRPPDPDRTYAAFVTKLPLTGHRCIPGFLRDTLRRRGQLRDASGFVGDALLAELVAPTFWTVSVWEDDDALRAFAGSEPHRTIMRRAPARMGASAFRPFAVGGADLPLRWPDVQARVP